MSSIAPIDLAALPASTWKAKLAALRSHYVPDDDPRVAECIAALSFWRFKRLTDAEVAAGNMSQAFADALLAKLRGAAVTS